MSGDTLNRIKAPRIIAQVRDYAGGQAVTRRSERGSDNFNSVCTLELDYIVDMLPPLYLVLHEG